MRKYLFIAILLLFTVSLQAQWGRSVRSGWGRGNREYNFDPSDFSPLCWYHAETGTGVTGDGDAITTWQNPYNADYNLTEATNKPTLQLDELNGYPVVRFDGTNDKLVQANRMTGKFPKALSYQIVFKSDDGITAEHQMPFGAYESVGNDNSYFSLTLRKDTGILRVGLSADNVGSVIDSNFPLSNRDTPWYIVTVTADSSDSLKMWINNEKQEAVELGSKTWAAITQANTEQIAVGNRMRDGSVYESYWFDGDIADLVIYDYALNDRQRRANERWFSRKYAIPYFEYSYSTPTVEFGNSNTYDMAPLIIRPPGADDTTLVCIYSEGTQHAVGPRRWVIQSIYDIASDCWSALDTVLSDSVDYRTRAIGVIDDSIYVWVSSQILPDGAKTRGWIKSGDGGHNWTEIDSLYPGVGGYGNIVATGITDRYVMGGYDNTMKSVVFYTDDAGATWDTLDVIPNGSDYNEFAIAYIGGSKLIGVLRHDTQGMFQTVSSDNGVTWSTPVNTGLIDNLVTGQTIYYDSPSGLVFVYYHDRNGATDGESMVATGVPNTVFDDATAWYSEKALSIGYSHNGYGYFARFNSSQLMLVYSLQEAADDARITVSKLTIF